MADRVQAIPRRPQLWSKEENGMNSRAHDVFNQFSELSDYNLFTTDSALTEALGRCADWSSDSDRNGRAAP
jgi:hypothetical protein